MLYVISMLVGDLRLKVSEKGAALDEKNGRKFAEISSLNRGRRAVFPSL